MTMTATTKDRAAGYMASLSDEDREQVKRYAAAAAARLRASGEWETEIAARAEIQRMAREAA